MISVGHESQCLYYFPISISYITCLSVESLNFIQQTLDHSSFEKLHCMVPSLSKVSTLEHKLSKFGKHSRSFFSDKVNKRVAFSFALVDFDIWGSSCVVSCLCYQYFVAFIDDFLDSLGYF